MKAAAAIGTASVFAVVLFRADMTMLAAFKPADVVGHYGAAYRLLEATLFVSWSVGSAVYPVFSRLSPTSEPAVGFVFERSLKLVVALTLPLAAGALVLAGPVVQLLYGSEYAEAANALRFLAPTIALYPVAYVAASLLVSQHRQRAMMIVYGLVAVENILANLVLIPWLSLDGAALGTSISQLLVSVALIVVSQQAAGGIQWARVAGGPILATLAATAGMVVLRDDFAAAVAAGAVALSGRALRLRADALPGRREGRPRPATVAHSVSELSRFRAGVAGARRAQPECLRHPWEWAETWWRHFGNDGELRTTVVPSVAVLPLYVERAGPFRLLRFIGHGHADEAGPVCAPRGPRSGRRGHARRLRRGRLPPLPRRQPADGLGGAARRARRRADEQPRRLARRRAGTSSSRPAARTSASSFDLQFAGSRIAASRSG